MKKFLSISIILHVALLLIVTSFLYREEISTISDSIIVGLIIDGDKNRDKKKFKKNVVIKPNSETIKTAKEIARKKTIKNIENNPSPLDESKKSFVSEPATKRVALNDFSKEVVIKTKEASNGSSQKGFENAYPNYKTNPKPNYPIIARKRGYEGEVLLKVWVLADGSIGELELEKPSGYAVLDQSALEAVRKWLFVPGKQNGVAISSWVTVPIKFKLKSG